MKRKKKKVVRTYRIARTAFGVPAPCSFAWWITLSLSSMLSSSSSSYSSFLILLVTSDFSSAFFLSALFPTYFWVDTGRIRGAVNWAEHKCWGGATDVPSSLSFHLDLFVLSEKHTGKKKKTNLESGRLLSWNDATSLFLSTVVFLD